MLSKGKVVVSSPVISVHAGLTLTSVIAEGPLPQQDANIAAGLGFKRQVMSSTCAFLMLNYEDVYIRNMQTQLVDIEYQESLNLSTTIRFRRFEAPILFCYTGHRFTVGLGIGGSFLLSARIRQDVFGASVANAANINTKYRKANFADASAFYKTNVAFCLHASWDPHPRVGLSFLLSCDLVANPIPEYSFFRSFNIVTSKLMLSFKIN